MAIDRKQIKGVLILLLTALIWGSSFVAQSVGLENIGTFTFTAVRMLFGAAVLIPVIIVRETMARKQKSSTQGTTKKEDLRQTLIGGALLGVVLCIATNLQQVALTHSSTGKVAFITTMYIVFVPLIGLFLKKRITVMTWICVVLGFVGLYFLCMNGASLGAVNVGDLYALACSVAFAAHILLIERFTDQTDGIKLSCVQFLTCSAVSAVLMLFFEKPTLAAIGIAIIPLLYSGVMSSGVAYTLQIIGQRYTSSAMASLVMCMESVFAVLAGALLLSETMTVWEILGCVILFVAIALPHVTDLIWNRPKMET